MLLCKWCGQTGYQPSDDKCPVKALETMVDKVEAFQGQGNPLSNLHTCDHGCEIHDEGTTFPSSEHHFQFKKLKHHDLGEEAYRLLMESDTFKVMKRAKELLPEDKLLDSWNACVQLYQVWFL